MILLDQQKDGYFLLSQYLTALKTALQPPGPAEEAKCPSSTGILTTGKLYMQ